MFSKYRVLIAIVLGSIAAMSSANTTVDFVSNEVLVKFKGTGAIANSYATIANRAIGAQTKTVIPRVNVNLVRVPAGMSPDDAVFYYSRLSTVEYAEKNAKKQLHFTPNDTLFNQQYGQKKVKCPEGWDISKGLDTVVVAVIDTGVDLNHEDLKNKVVAGFDFSDNDSDPTAAGDHGVHTAGIVGAETNNNKGVAGTGYNVKVMPLKIFPNATDAVSAAAIIYAADHGAKVASMSYGAYFESTTERNAINYAFGKGMVLCSSSGNDNITNQSFPAAFPNVIAVGSTGTEDIRSGFSNYGADWVDVAAPGENVLSTITGGYAELTGTSMSCPMVAGVAGLLWSQALPGTTNVQIRNAIESTTDPVPGNFFKFGRVNAFKALQQLDPGSATLSDVVGAGLWFGAGTAGLFTDMNATDSNFFVVNSSTSNVGQLAGATVDIGFNGSASNLRESLAFIEANGPKGSSGQLFLWDTAGQKYVLIKAFALQPTGTKRQKLLLPKDLTPYVSGGILRMGIRAIGPNRTPRTWSQGAFDFQIGFVQVSTRENN